MRWGVSRLVSTSGADLIADPGFLVVSGYSAVAKVPAGIIRRGTGMIPADPLMIRVCAGFVPARVWIVYLPTLTIYEYSVIVNLGAYILWL